MSLKSGQIQARNHDLEPAGTFTVDRTVSGASVDEFDALVLPGGTVNPDKLRRDSSAVSFVRDFVASGKPVAAICHGPWTLVEAGVVAGRTLTSYPSIRTDLRNADATVVDEEVVIDGGRRDSTAAGPGFNHVVCGHKSCEAVTAAAKRRKARDRRDPHREQKPSMRGLHGGMGAGSVSLVAVRWTGSPLPLLAIGSSFRPWFRKRYRLVLDPVTDGTDQQQATPTGAGVGDRCFPRTEVDDPHMNFGVLDFGLDPYLPDARSPGRVLDAVGARLVDGEHDVSGERIWDGHRLQPRGEPMPDIGQSICGATVFDSKRGVRVPVHHHRDVVVISRCGASSRSTASATASADKLIVVFKTRVARDSFVDGLVFPLDQSVGEQRAGAGSP